MCLNHFCFPWFAVRVDSQIFLLTSQGILCVFYHKYRKAIQHEARPDQSGASIFGVEILGLHFQTLSLILLLIGPAFPGTDMDPIRHQVNTPVWFNRRPNHWYTLLLVLALSISTFCPTKLKIESWELLWSAVVGSLWICSQFCRSLKQSWIYPWPSFAGERLAAPPFCPNQLSFVCPNAAHHPTHQANQSTLKVSVLELHRLNPIPNQTNPDQNGPNQTNTKPNQTKGYL